MPEERILIVEDSMIVSLHLKSLLENEGYRVIGVCDTAEEAVAYAQSHEIPFEVIEPNTPKKILKAYADNFAYGRKQPWTH